MAHTDQLIKALAYNDQVRIYLIDLTQTVREGSQRHEMWHTATAAYGRTLVAAALLAGNLKGEDRLTVQVKGEGPIGRILCQADAKGHVRGYVDNPHVALELNDEGKLDVKGAVGLPGMLSVTKQLAVGEPFTGQVPLVSGELAEDFTYYMAVSEQTPSSIGLSVLVNQDETVRVAGGFMIQVLPGATDETIEQLEANINQLGRFSSLLDSGKSLEDIMNDLVNEQTVRILSREPVVYQCSCSKEHFEDRLLLLSKEDLKQLIEEDEGAEVICHYCNDHYNFTKEELENILALKEEK